MKPRIQKILSVIMLISTRILRACALKMLAGSDVRTGVSYSIFQTGLSAVILMRELAGGHMGCHNLLEHVPPL